jgi:hypothetical protein
VWPARHCLSPLLVISARILSSLAKSKAINVKLTFLHDRVANESRLRTLLSSLAKSKAIDVKLTFLHDRVANESRLRTLLSSLAKSKRHQTENIS